jgi:hypothetical protein
MPPTISELKGICLIVRRKLMAALQNLELSLIDLRAHFEAQLRTVKRGEECLLRCRGAQDAVAFDAAADAFRNQLTAVAQDRKTIGELLNQIVDDARRPTFADRGPKA